MSDKEYEGVGQLLDQLARELPAPPAGLADRALARARAEMVAEVKTARKRSFGWRNLPQPATALAGIAAAVVVVLALAGRPGSPRLVPRSGSPPASMEARSHTQTETREEARLPDGQAGRVRVMLGGAPQAAHPDATGEQSWEEVFAGASAEAQLVIDRLTARGIAARLEMTEKARAKVSVRPVDAESARALIRTVSSPPDAPDAPKKSTHR
ncbi:MAG: hypothetical protein ACM3XZ_03560 [Betaproteobacteria bacterium]